MAPSHPARPGMTPSRPKHWPPNRRLRSLLTCYIVCVRERWPHDRQHGSRDLEDPSAERSGVERRDRPAGAHGAFRDPRADPQARGARGDQGLRGADRSGGPGSQPPRLHPGPHQGLRRRAPHRRGAGRHRRGAGGPSHRRRGLLPGQGAGARRPHPRAAAPRALRQRRRHLQHPHHDRPRDPARDHQAADRRRPARAGRPWHGSRRGRRQGRCRHRRAGRAGGGDPP